MLVIREIELYYCNLRLWPVVKENDHPLLALVGITDDGAWHRFRGVFLFGLIPLVLWEILSDVDA